MSERTKGPWRWEEDEGCNLFSVFGSDDSLVVEMPLNGHIETESQARADARLIAAAPDLLGALKQCDDAFAHWQTGTVPGRPEDILALITKVRAAIAKAEGK